MPDVGGFIDAIGKDVSAAVAARAGRLVEEIGTRLRAEYGRRVSEFADQLVKDILDRESDALRTFIAGVLDDLARRPQPELKGEVRTRIVQGGIEVQGEGIRLDIRNRDTGEAVASLEVPLSLRIDVGPLAVDLQETTIKVDVIR